MIPKDNTPIKAMAFAGCSFTWGQSLWYYSNLDSVIVQGHNKYDPQYVNFSHRAFTEANRFPRLVAKHFNTFELCQPFNGGSNSSILDYWRDYALNENSEDNLYRITNKNNKGPVYNLSDIGYFICQFTAWPRTDIQFEINGKQHGPMQRWSLYSDRQSLFYDYLDENHTSIDRFFDQCKASDVANIRNFLLHLQQNGVRVFCLSWPSDLVPYILQDEFLKNIFIELQYEGNTYTDIQALIEHNPTLEISKDIDFFITPPKDDHPSLKCHRVIADSIIRHIEKENEQWKNQYLHPTKTA